MAPWNWPGALARQYLSERSAILAAGLATVPWAGLMGWFEAGESFRYVSSGMVPDYRRLTYTRGLGAMLRGGAHGLFR